MTIRTSLDKNLQEEIDRMEEGITSRDDAPVAGRIIVVKQADQVRAITCSVGQESAIREALTSRGLLEPEYDVMIVPTDGVIREQIVLAVEGEPK